MRRMSALTVALVLPALLVLGALAQKTFSQEVPAATAPVLPPATQPAADAQHYLGKPIRSPEYGIVFGIPTSCKVVERGLPDVVGEYVDDDKHWVIRVDRVILRKPLPLSVHADETLHATPGVLEGVQDQIAKLPHSDLARKDVLRINNLNIGVLFARYQTIKGDPWTVQKAVVEAPTMGQQVYYLLEFTAPDDDEPTLAGVFDAMVHSVQLLDTRAIREDQEDRLFNTHLLFVDWKGAAGEARIRKVLQDQQWMRIIQDGQDTGYTCVLQQCPADPRNSKPGDRIRIGIATRMIPKKGALMNAVTWMTCTLDRKHETWSTTFDANDEQAKKTDHYTELGVSDEVDKPVVEASPAPKDSAEVKDHEQNNISLRQVRTVTVTAMRNKTPRDKFAQQTPAWYCPQAISLLLPRLLPLNPPKKYLVAIYDNGAASDGTGRIVGRYLDVLPVATVTFNGKQQLATIINDRVTLQGAVTSHYFALDGTYLGSESKIDDADGNPHVSMIVPSDETTLRQVWPQYAVDKPAEAAPVPPEPK